jgi:cell division protein FtsW (lipid II flippase)
MLLIGGLKPRWFLVLGLAGVVLVAGLLSLNSTLDRTLGRDVLIKQYQLNRLLIFVDPTLDPKGAGYNLEQSKIAIGSGELTGKGLKSGTQSNLRFLPEPHTDFIFAVTAEELGLLGATVIVALFAIFLYRAIRTAVLTDDTFARYLATGIGAMVGVQALFNISVVLGMAPTKGIPLPFISYGGSSLFITLLSVGVLLNITQHTD